MKIFTLSLLAWLATPAQQPASLAFRPLEGYSLSKNVVLGKTKPMAWLFNSPANFNRTFQPTATRSSGKPDFRKETVVGIAVPPAPYATALTVLRIGEQKGVLTIGYTKKPGDETTSFVRQPTVLVAIPKSRVTHLNLIENGKPVSLGKREALK